MRRNYCSMIFFTLAGTPAAIALSGRSSVTTLPAAMTHPLPMVTPCSTETFAPNQQLSPTLIGSARSRP